MPFFIDVVGGDEGDRTPDLCNAIAALSQLSYVHALNFKFGVSSPSSKTTKFESIENACERQGGRESGESGESLESCESSVL